jgi:hypothetical protein
MTRTTGDRLRLGGVLLVLAAGLLLVRAVAITVPVDEAVAGALSGWDLLLLAGLLLLAATLVLATRVVGTSRLGRLGLIAFGAQDIGFLVLGLAVEPAMEAGPVTIAFGTIWQVCVLVGIVAAAALAVRARVLLGVARWSLVPVAAVQLLLTGLQYVPTAKIVPVLDVLGVVQPAVLVAAGCAIAAQGIVGSRAPAGAAAR